jgi:RNA polymerase sigma-70 factor (ECF subfamily)
MWLLAVVDRWSSEGGRAREEDRARDRETIRRVAAGDTSALAELYDRHARVIYSLVMRIVGVDADAEDVVQDVFTQAWRQAWRQAARYEEGRGAVGAWLLTIARSRAIDRLRSRRGRPDEGPADEHVLLSFAAPDPSQDSVLLAHERGETVRAALESLPLLQRVAIELAYYEGLTQAEIATRLEQPLGTVKTRIRLGLLKLREALTEART